MTKLSEEKNLNSDVPVFLSEKLFLLPLTEHLAPQTVLTADGQIFIAVFSEYVEAVSETVSHLLCAPWAELAKICVDIVEAAGIIVDPRRQQLVVMRHELCALLLKCEIREYKGNAWWHCNELADDYFALICGGIGECGEAQTVETLSEQECAGVKYAWWAKRPASPYPVFPKWLRIVLVVYGMLWVQMFFAAGLSSLYYGEINYGGLAAAAAMTAGLYLIFKYIPAYYRR